ncbi:hypothetical protein Goklo_011254, partial [Gossypium klotzschianum]|nr:hypothetical protein [Gossypium klotzschianum]
NPSLVDEEEVLIQFHGDSEAFGHFIGQFDQYDATLVTREIMRKLGHGEGFCPLRMTIVVHVVEFGWDASLRAPSRREAMMSRKWLQENCSGINQAGGNSFHMDVDGRGEGKSFSDIQIALIQRNRPIEQIDGKKRQRMQSIRNY